MQILFGKNFPSTFDFSPHASSLVFPLQRKIDDGPRNRYPPTSNSRERNGSLRGVNDSARLRPIRFETSHSIAINETFDLISEPIIDPTVFQASNSRTIGRSMANTGCRLAGMTSKFNYSCVIGTWMRFKQCADPQRCRLIKEREA